jgi:alpha-tubulin suppressor-like RCC1 family protein
MLAQSCTRSAIRCRSIQQCARQINASSSQSRRAYSHQTTSRTTQRYIIGASAIGFAILSLQASKWYLFANVYAEEQESDPTPVFEKQRRQAKSKEDNRDIISSQHLQVKRSWENPGVYAWGSNTGRVVAPDSNEKFIKTARRIPFFDGILLRDIKLDRTFGVAIDERGDLYQWGTGYKADFTAPEKTLKGKSLRSLAISRDRILALSDNGTVYSVPVSQDEQQSGPKVSESSWIPFLSSISPISYRNLTPKNLERGEKIASIAGGLEHVLLMTSKGRLYSAAASSADFPRRGQLGVPGLTWQSRPPGAYDQPHEIMTLHGFKIQSIAAGDYHSLASDKEGRVFAFGDNSLGQLGLDFNVESSIIDVPSLLPIQQLYAGTAQVPRVTSVAAGGSNSYFTIDATRVASQAVDETTSSRERLGLVTADTWACGQGIWGNLANGRWTHVQTMPTKIQTLSGLFEYDEIKNVTIPIRLARLSVGQTHAAAVMDNVTYLDASTKTSENDTNWGADIVFWGNNEFYQLGTGKRNNVSTPLYIQPLDRMAEDEVVKGRGKEVHRFQITPKKKVKVNGRNVQLEQRVECGRGTTAVYSGV